MRVLIAIHDYSNLEDIIMCMHVLDKTPPSEPISVWKIVLVRDGVIRSPYQHTYKWNVGENKPVYRVTYPPYANLYSAGVLHAYITPNVILDWVLYKVHGEYAQLIRLTGYPEDFVAFGYNREVCFTKLHLSQEDYDNAIKSQPSHQTEPTAA